MSILETLFGGLFGTDDQEQQQETTVERPCSNCPSYCSIAPNACSVCQPYKEQMIDALYWVNHKEELISRYEVTGVAGAQTGAVICPHCGGTSEDPYVCEYCGSKLQEGDGKIRVASAADIPNPVLEAQDIIFQRYEAVKGYAGADEAYGLTEALSGVQSEGLLSSIFSALTGSASSESSRTIGNRMSESEIEQMASFYSVSVADYLEGLDNGKYLTLSNKETAARAEQQYSSTSASQSGSISGLTGLAGALGLGSLLFGGSSYNYSAARKPSGKRPTVVVKDPVPGHERPSRPQTTQNGSHMPRPDSVQHRPQSIQHLDQQTVRPAVSQQPVRPQAPVQQVKPQQAKPQQAKPQQVKPQQAKPQQVKPQQSKPQQFTPNTSQQHARPQAPAQNSQRSDHLQHSSRPSQGSPSGKPGSGSHGNGHGGGGRPAI